MTDTIRSTTKHFWWCCATCDKDDLLLKEKWLTILLSVYLFILTHFPTPSVVVSFPHVIWQGEVLNQDKQTKLTCLLMSTLCFVNVLLFNRKSALVSV